MILLTSITIIQIISIINIALLKQGTLSLTDSKDLFSPSLKFFFIIKYRFEFKLYKDLSEW